MKKRRLLLTALLIATSSLTSCGFFNSTDSNTNTNTNNTTSTTDTKKDDTKSNTETTTDTTKDNTQTDTTKEGDSSQGGKEEDVKQDTYTSTFYTYGNNVFKTITKKKGERVKNSDIHTGIFDFPKRPNDDVNHIEYTFADKWVVKNGDKKGEVIKSSSESRFANDIVGLDVDYDIEYEAQFYESTADYAVNFYLGDRLLFTARTDYDTFVSKDADYKKAIGYYEPKGVKDGKLVEFAGWSTNASASYQNALSYDNLPKVTGDINYYAIFKPVTDSSKFVYVVTYSEPPTYYASDHNYFKNSNYFAYSNNTLTKFNSTIFAQSSACEFDVYFGYQNLFTSIGEKAFQAGDHINNIDFGSKITSLGNYCFFNSVFNKLSSANLTSIGEGCFNGAVYGEFPQLAKVTTIPEKAFFDSTFKNEKGDNIINIPSTVTSIGDYAFGGMIYNYVNSLNIPTATTSISTKAFIPFEITGAQTIAGKYRIKEFKVDSNNTKYSSENGHLIDKVNKSLIACGLNNNTIPSGVTKINSYAFSSILTDTIIIPSSVNSIAKNAFWSSEIENIKFGGTESQFKQAISKDSFDVKIEQTKVTFSNNTSKSLKDILSSLS